MINLFKHGIYGGHIEGQYCEAKFFNDNIVDCFVDKYDSDIELNTGILNTNNITWFKKRDFNKTDFNKE
jgi:hypothetical protein